MGKEHVSQFEKISKNYNQEMNQYKDKLNVSVSQYLEKK